MNSSYIPEEVPIVQASRGDIEITLYETHLWGNVVFFDVIENVYMRVLEIRLGNSIERHPQ